jgi:DNA-binding MarR family transcriptional regulator
MDLIAAICFLRQFQKEEHEHTVGTTPISYICCDIEDYTIAYTIMTENVLKAVLTELTPSDSTLHDAIREMAQKLAKEHNLKVNEVSFSQRDIREHTGFGQSWIKQHLRTLVEYEYVLIARGNRNGYRNTYTLRADEPLQQVNASCILSPGELEKQMKKDGLQ